MNARLRWKMVSDQLGVGKGPLFDKVGLMFYVNISFCHGVSCGTNYVNISI